MNDADAWMAVKWRIRLPFGWAIEFCRYYPEPVPEHVTPEEDR